MFKPINLHDVYLAYFSLSIINIILGVGVFLIPSDYLETTRYFFIGILALFDILATYFYCTEDGEFTPNDFEVIKWVNLLFLIGIIFTLTKSIVIFVGLLVISNLYLISIVLFINPLHSFHMPYLKNKGLFFQLSFHSNVYKTTDYQEYKAKKAMINNKQLTDKDKLDMLNSIEDEFESYLRTYLTSFNTRYVGVFKKNQDNSDFKQSSKEIRQALEKSFNELKKTE